MKRHTPQENQSHQPEILLAENLHKSYGPRQALAGLSFSLKAGRILGFLGPNGAGKTTAIRILTTLLEPDSGRFVVNGIDSKYPQAIRRRIGVLPENLGFPRQITAVEYLTYFGQLYGRSAKDAKAYGLALLEEVGLEQRARSLVGTYSHGMKQRLGIARALVNAPVVAFLDEPTLGLDPRGQQELLSLIKRIVKERNVGVVLCSHALSEIDAICDDVVILMAGRVIASGTVIDVIKQTRQNAFRVQVPPPSLDKARRVLKALPSILDIALTDETTGWLRLELEDENRKVSTENHQINNKILGALVRAKIPVLSFGADGGRLQDVFLQLTEEEVK
ncbi:MAG: ABC transporter ATP-binding protein [Chloroflexota bacterium]